MKVYVMLADGFEEIEALTAVDVLRRGEIETTMVSVQDTAVTSSHGIVVTADKLLNEIIIQSEDAIVIPGGGKGVQGLSASEKLMTLLKEHNDRKGLIAAICAGPTIPGKLGLLKGLRATCYPGCEMDLKGAIISDEAVVEDENFITSRGPGQSLAFAFAILTRIAGKEKAQKVRSAMLL